MPDGVTMFFDSPDIMGAYRMDSWKIHKFGGHELLGDPRKTTPANYQAYVNPVFEHMPVFVHQKEAFSGMDTAAVFKMDLQYDKAEKCLTAKAKLAVNTSIDNGDRSAGVGVCLHVGSL